MKERVASSNLANHYSLFATRSSFEPDGSPEETCGVEIFGVAHGLIAENRLQALVIGLRASRAAREIGRHAARHRLGEHAPHELAVGGRVQFEKREDGLAEIGIACRRLIDIARLEVGS